MESWNRFGLNLTTRSSELRVKCGASLFACAALLFTGSGNAFAQDRITSAQKSVTSETGQTVEVESGMLTVPENRKKPNGKTIEIAYYRLKSEAEHPGPAVFLLAGGPGASWIDSFEKHERFDEVAFYRQFSDVVIFDQRGAGHSRPNLESDLSVTVPKDKPLNDKTIREPMRELILRTKQHWLDQGVDLTSYNTDESASDIDDLRQALGYEKIILIGGSYGSHLGLHTVRKFPSTIDRAVFYGIEGPDHTWDMPSGTLDALKQIAATAEASEAYKGRIPEGGLIAALETVVRRVSQDPVTVMVGSGFSRKRVEVNAWAVQRTATFNAGRRSQPEFWPDLIIAMYNGDFTMIAEGILGMREITAPSGMSMAMDLASSISRERLVRVQNDPAREILGDINMSYAMTTDLGFVPVLDDEFRKNVESDVPVLLIHGTWDTSTPIDNAREVVATLRNGHLIEVVGGTHGALYNLYEHWGPMHGLMRKFLTGENVDFPDSVEMPPVQFPVPATEEQDSLWDAVIAGNVKAAKAAIESGADVNALDTRRSQSGRRPLNWAAQHDRVEIIVLLLANGADIDATNNTGFTPLHHAAENNSVRALKALLDAGADPSLPSKRGKTPLQTATDLGHTESVKLLRERMHSHVSARAIF